MPIAKPVKKPAIISSWVCLFKVNPDQATFVFCDDSRIRKYIFGGRKTSKSINTSFPTRRGEISGEYNIK